MMTTGSVPKIHVTVGKLTGAAHATYTPLPAAPAPPPPGPDPVMQVATTAQSTGGRKLPDSVLKHLPPITVVGGPGTGTAGTAPVHAATDENGVVIGPTINADDLHTGASTDVNEGQWTSGNLKLPDYNLFSALLRSIPMDPPVNDDDIAAMWGDPEHPAPDTKTPFGETWIAGKYTFSIDRENGHRQQLSTRDAEIAKAQNLTPAQWLYKSGIQTRRSYRGTTPVGKSKDDADKDAAKAQAILDKAAADKLAADTAAALKKIAAGTGTGGLVGGLPVAKSSNTALIAVGVGLAAYLAFKVM